MKRLAVCVFLLGIIACLSACKGDGASSTEILPPDRLMLTFAPADEYSNVSTDASAVVLNYLSLLSQGEYAEALEYCYIPDGVIFDEVALQRNVLAQGIGRGDSITFYDATDYGSSMDVEYDLTLSGMTSTYSFDIPYVKLETGEVKINIEGCDFIEYGTLYFEVPKYVDVYINGVYVDKSFMDVNYCYNISTGIAKIPGDEGEDASTGMTLELRTKFNINEEYSLYFKGSCSKSKNSCNDAYYRSNKDRTVFTMSISREKREEVLEYLKADVIPVLMNDVLHGTSWDVANVRRTFGPDTLVDNMFSNYYKRSNAFAAATTKDGGQYFFYELSTYSYAVSDREAERLGGSICISDWNVMDIYVTLDYNYLYTKGSSNTERNAQGTLSGLVQLSVDDVGNYYVHYFDDNMLKLTLG